LSKKHKEREKERQIYRKGETILGFAEYHIRRPRLDLLLGMGPQAIGPNPVPTFTCSVLIIFER